MGTIARVTQVPAERYNKILVYKGSGNVAMAGWGVRARDEDPGSEGNSLVCLSHPMRSNTIAKYATFRVINASGTPDSDYVVVSIWKYNSTSPFNINLVYRKVINKTVLEENYGTGTTFTDDTEYTITLEDDGVYLEPISNVSYYMGVYADGCELELDLDGTTNGAYIKTGADISLSSTYAIASLTLSDKAVSCEIFSEPDTWVKQLNGGAIALENTDWHNALYCTASGWANPDRIYDGTAAHADSTTIGDYIIIDLGAGLVPTSPWPGPGGLGLISGSDDDVFPDYTDYGVRCIYELVISYNITSAGDPGRIEILISAEDDASAPSYGFERVLALTAGTGTYRLQLPAIARWVKIVHTTGADQIEISDFKVIQISYGITDGNFPVDVLSSTHNVWIENYPTQEKVRRLAMGNMAGGVSLPGKPFTNRENID